MPTSKATWPARRFQLGHRVRLVSHAGTSASKLIPLGTQGRVIELKPWVKGLSDSVALGYWLVVSFDQAVTSRNSIEVWERQLALGACPDKERFTND